MALPVGILAAARAGLLRIAQSTAVKKWATETASGLGRIGVSRALSRTPAQTELRNYAVSQAATGAQQAVGTYFKRSGAPQRILSAKDRIITPMERIGLQASERAGQATSRAYGSLVARNFRVAPGPDGPVMQNPVLNATTQGLRAYHSPGGRFARSAVKRGLIDYATYRAIEIGTNAANSLYLDEYKYQDHSVTPHGPGGLHSSSQGVDEAQDERTQIIQVAVNSIVGASITSRINKLRRSQVSLSNVRPSTANKFGRRLSENTLQARAYYGSRIPEVTGEITGMAGAMYAMGADPREVASNLGARGAINAGVGFYNVGRPAQMRLPTMGPRYMHKVKTPRTVRKAERTVRKAQQTTRVAQQHLQTRQLRLF